MKLQENLVGAWAMLIGIVVAIILGVFQKYILGAANAWIYLILVALGIVIGIASVSNNSQDATTFLLVIVALVIVSAMGQDRTIKLAEIDLLIATILNALLTMFIPAAIIVSIKTLFSVANVK